MERLAENDWARWDAFVLSHPQGTIYHTSRWRAVIEQTFPHMRGFFVAAIENGTERILGGLPFYKVSHPLRGSSHVSVPHATFCQPLLTDGLNSDALLELPLEWLTTMESRALEIRWLHSDRSDLLSGGSGAKHFLHHKIKLDVPLDRVWQSLARTAIRQRIVKAEKSGVIVSKATTPTELEVYYEMLLQTRHRLGLPLIPWEFLKNIWNTLEHKHCSLLLARQGERVLGGVMATKANRLFLLEHYGESPDARGTGINSLVYWRALCEAHSEGFAEFSFGRTGDSNDGLSTYKRQWGCAEEKVVYRTIRAKSNSLKKWKLPVSRDWMQELLRSLPGPVYEGVSKAFYRYWM